MTEMLNLANEYINGKVDSKVFTQKCKHLYRQAITTCERNMELELLKALPFIHEFAYVSYSDLELTTQVSYFFDVMNGKKEYHYSTFVQLSALDAPKSKLYDLYNRFDDISIEELRQLFTEHIAYKSCLNDILYSAIREIFLNFDANNPSAFDFDSINCCEETIRSKIKDRLHLLLSYYLGLEVFLLQIHSQPNIGTAYTII